MRFICVCCIVAAVVVAGCKDSDKTGAVATVPDKTFQAGSGVGTGRLSPNKDGVVMLPDNLKGASADSKAYVKKIDQTLWVLLVEKMDSPQKFTGWIFGNNPPAQAPATLDLLGPSDGAKPAAVTVKVGKPAGDGWYAVSAGK